MRTGVHGPFHWNVPHSVGTYQILARWVHKFRAETSGERGIEGTESGGEGNWAEAGGRRQIAQKGRAKRGAEGEEERERASGCYEATDLRSPWFWYVLRVSTAEKR